MEVEKPRIMQKFVPNTLDDSRIPVTIKVHKNRNEYIKVDDYWIRNFGKPDVDIRDLNNLYDKDDLKNIVANEIRNTKFNHPEIANETFSFNKVLIVSDGFNFHQHKDVFPELSEDTCVIAVNQALRLWQSIVFPEYYLICNTTDAAMSYLPKKQFPKLIASRRTYHNFVKNYRNIIYLYDPSPDFTYQSPYTKEALLLVDDYRNPICAAIGLAYFMKASKIFLAYCSHAYKEPRDGTEKLEEGIYQYPQQRLGDKIVDGNLLWYRENFPDVSIYHTGIKNSFMFAKYLSSSEFTDKLIYEQE